MNTQFSFLIKIIFCLFFYTFKENFLKKLKKNKIDFIAIL